MLDAGVISPSSSPWTSPVVVIPKKDGGNRFCVDFRKLNKLTKKDAYLLPDIQTIFDNMAGMKYVSIIDAASGFWQIPMNEDSKALTAFVTEDGIFEFNVMPFGLSNAPATYQRNMDILLRSQLGRNAEN